MLGVASHRPAWVVFVGGWLVVGGWAVDFLVEGSVKAAPVVLPVLGLFIFGFTAVTRRGVPVAADAIVAGGIAGVSAALLPVPVFMFRPPVPASIVWALVVIAAATVAAGVMATRRGGPRFLNAVLSGLLAAVVAAMLIGPVVTMMLQFGPERWVPRMVSHALTPADRLAERRHLSAEPYLLVLLLGAALALLLGVLALRSRRRGRSSRSVRSVGAVGGPGHIELGEV